MPLFIVYIDRFFIPSYSLDIEFVLKDNKITKWIV